MIGFVLRYWRVILPVLGAGLLAGAFFGYGAIKYREGYKDAERALKSKIEASVLKAHQNASQDNERIQHEEQTLDDAGIDRALDELGIMRRADDR
jgi:hypothetical protein